MGKEQTIFSPPLDHHQCSGLPHSPANAAGYILSTERPLKEKATFHNRRRSSQGRKRRDGCAEGSWRRRRCSIQVGTLYGGIIQNPQHAPRKCVTLGGTPQTHTMEAIGRTLRRARTNTLKPPVPNGAGGYRLKRLLVAIMPPKCACR